MTEVEDGPDLSISGDGNVRALTALGERVIAALGLTEPARPQRLADYAYEAAHMLPEQAAAQPVVNRRAAGDVFIGQLHDGNATRGLDSCSHGQPWAGHCDRCACLHPHDLDVRGSAYLIATCLLLAAIVAAVVARWTG
jgi:hypothetical protein